MWYSCTNHKSESRDMQDIIEVYCWLLMSYTTPKRSQFLYIYSEPISKFKLMQFFWIHLKFTNEILDSQIKPYPLHLTISLKTNWPIDNSRLAAIKQLSVSTLKLQYVCGCVLADLFLVWRTSFLYVIKVYIFSPGLGFELDWLYHKVFIAAALE